MDDVHGSTNLENEYETEFTLAEIVEMENLYKEKGETLLNQQTCEELATKFSSSLHRRGKSTIKWQQVHSWFLDSKKEQEIKISSSHQRPEELVRKRAAQSSSSVYSRRLDAFLHKRVQQHATETPRKPIGMMLPRSSPTELRIREVRVRFAGFDKDEDEWINVKWGVRQRSIPLEPSECGRIKVGDLVLCFREEEHRAVYCDAYVEEIERISHDSEDCKCIFHICYDCDDVKVKVQLHKLCYRPT